MLNNAWPSMIWHLYDYYLLPGGGYYGTKKACEPVHVQYSYDDRSVVVVNNTPQSLDRLKVVAKVFDLNMVEKYSNSTGIILPAGQNVRAFEIPALEGLTTTYFLKLSLEDPNGSPVSSNFYWLSTKEDVLDWNKSTWYHTPTTSAADFTALQSLPQVQLSVLGRVERKGGNETARITIQNPGRTLALSIRMQIKRGRNGEEVLPVIWQDNYFELMPGEKRELTATYKSKDLEGSSPVVAVGGWNVEPKVLGLAPPVRRKSGLVATSNPPSD
jgi:exo-1,4-beta-D-glucosaminidase